MGETDNDDQTLSEAEETCPDCGAPLKAGALGGLCPHCLLQDVVDDQEAEEGSALPDLAGRQIDGYHLIEKLGEGGMGSVWRARQEAPIEREVALKLIKAGMESQSLIARFEAERQLLADLDHPGIAKIFDAGTTDAGRPYYVMELVDGLPITGYCERWQLHTRDRLGLLVKVCEAVGHAHAKGIIHRDIKPSNILVADHVEGRLKVIDFGVAKSDAGSSAIDLTLATHAGQMIGTPAYMSPEQAAGDEEIDGRADVYSLGAVLYELLCEHPPFGEERLREIGLLEVARVIREEEPPRPSKRSDDTPGGDLDWITLKALAKNPEHRYQQPADLADDLERYLRGEQVSARAPTLWTKAGKSLRRHRVAAIAVAAAIPLALGVFALTRPQGDAPDLAEQHASAMVSTTADSGAGSLRELIATVPPRSKIEFAPELSGQTILLDGAPLTIEKKLTIDGSALEKQITFDAGGRSRVLVVTGANTLVNLIGLTLTGGDAGEGDGGAILATAAVEMERCQVRHNRAQNGGGLFIGTDVQRIYIKQSVFTDNVAVGDGGAIHRRVLSFGIDESTFARNEAHRGGALYGSFKLRNCTVVDNACVARDGVAGIPSGGAVMIDFYGQLDLVHATVSGNRAVGVGGVHCAHPKALLEIQNSIVFGNVSTSGAEEPDLVVEWFPNYGSNLIGGEVDPKLAPLGDYGGSVPTRPPLPGSIAIDTAGELKERFVTVRFPGTRDARGITRPIDGDPNRKNAPDIGAVEFDPARDQR